VYCATELVSYICVEPQQDVEKHGYWCTTTTTTTAAAAVIVDANAPVGDKCNNVKDFSAKVGKEDILNLHFQ
jgi:hypothetical protein